MVISSKVAACTSQPVAFSGHLSTGECLPGLRNKLQQKQTSQVLTVVIIMFVSPGFKHYINLCFARKLYVYIINHCMYVCGASDVSCVPGFVNCFRVQS